MALDGTYTGLQASIAAFMHRSDLSSVIPDLIRLAEGRIARDLRIQQMVNSIALPTVAGAPTVALPTGFLEFESIGVIASPSSSLSYVSSEWLGKNYPDDSYSGLPGFYTIEGTNLVLGPTPDAVYSINATYYKRFDPLTTTPTNWLLTNHPAVYLYGSLIEASIYTLNQSSAQAYQGKYLEAANEVQLSDTKGKYSGSVLSAKAM